jgi:hypothetical protein
LKIDREQHSSVAHKHELNVSDTETTECPKKCPSFFNSASEIQKKHKENLWSSANIDKSLQMQKAWSTTERPETI